MNIRKNIDYGEMYAALDHATASEMGQMELYCTIGKAVSLRPEKGAAVAAAKYLAKHCPDAHGFSPRNVRRMRDFYRTYENHPVQLEFALQIGWTQNVIIMEADLSMELREWYLRAAKQFDWSKMELVEEIAANAHEKIVLAIEDDLCYSEERKNEASANNAHEAFGVVTKKRYLIHRYKCQCSSREGSRRRWPIMLCPIFMEKRIAFTQCWRKINFLRKIRCTYWVMWLDYALACQEIAMKRL